MIDSLSITVLADNSAALPHLHSEHGLSLLIEAGSRRILFDTGQSDLALRNAALLGISLSNLDAIVLSHGHYDHTGGLAAILAHTTPAAIHLHPAALQPRYALTVPPPHRSVGIPQPSLDALNTLPGRLHFNTTHTQIAPGIHLTGEIPRLAGNLQSVSGFFLDPHAAQPDTLPDDQALAIETTRGLVVVSGCAHSGIVNTVDRAATLLGCKEVYAVLGGFHLARASRFRLDAVTNGLALRNCRLLAPCHCTGPKAVNHLRARFHSILHDAGAGSRFNLCSPEPAP